MPKLVFVTPQLVSGQTVRKWLVQIDYQY